MMGIYLFVGGPSDGRWREVNDDQQMVGINHMPELSVASFYGNAPPLTRAVERHTYCRKQFRGETRRVTVYAHDSINCDDVLEGFVARYQPGTAIPGKLEVFGWRPIETAPKDGTWIIAWQPHISDCDARIMRWYSGMWVSDYGVAEASHRDPKYWTPLSLPEPPR